MPGRVLSDRFDTPTHFRFKMEVDKHKIKFKKNETLDMLLAYQKNRVWVTHTRYDNI